MLITWFVFFVYIAQDTKKIEMHKIIICVFQLFVLNYKIP